MGFGSLNFSRRKIVAIGVANAVAGILTWLGIYHYGEYGIALFFLVPFLLGMIASLILGYGGGVPREEAVKISAISIVIFLMGLFLLAWEGLICIIMSLPVVVPMSLLGGVAAHALMDEDRLQYHVVGVLLLGFPLLSVVEQGIKPRLHAVRTEVEIAASPEAVWEQVIAFPALEAPRELLFRAGISYPTHATIEGEGVGAVRYCHFNTGQFVEPITVWEPPHRLAFSVERQPPPMRELSFWDIHAPHLHDYFVSERGQFVLDPLPNGHTRLVGTTWYYHDIRPAFYWKWWSDGIIHRIHKRVLDHIRAEVEADGKNQYRIGEHIEH